MKMICCLRDRIAGNFLQPFFVPSAGVAARQLGDEVRRVADGNLLNTHPGDFELFDLGHFDEETGVIRSHSSPVFLMQVSALAEVRDEKSVG